MGSWVIHNAELTARQLGLSISCLDATLIVSYEIDGTVHIYMYGDGVVIASDGENILIDYIEFTNNAPYYLTYLIDEFRDEVYHSNKNSKALITRYKDEELLKNRLAYDSKVVMKHSTSEYPTILICSDGIQSFIKKDPSQRDVLPIEVVAPEMLAFKNLKGEFLKRRLKRALKTFENDGIVHYDDLSIGAYTRIK